MSRPSASASFLSSGACYIIYSDTLQRFWVSCCPGGAEKAPVVQMSTSKAPMYLYETGAGRVPVSNRTCYLRCPDRSDNRGYRILSRSRNTNLSLTSNLKQSSKPRFLTDFVVLWTDAIWPDEWLFDFQVSFVTLKLILQFLNRKCNFSLILQN